MHPFFEPLGDREAMLLLTTLTVGGSDETAIFEHLPPEAATRLRDKARALLEIPKEKRVPFMVKQMEQAMTFKGLRGVERIDPSWLLQAMRGETPRVVATILIALPPASVRSILKRLPSGIRKNLPPKDELKRVPVEIVRAVREQFEARFHPMPAAAGRTFGFRDVIHLDRRELRRLIRDLGLLELGQAFAAVGKLALGELCRRLPRARAEELILAVRHASKTDPPDLKTAQRFLSKVVINFDDTEEFFFHAGLWRMGRAAVAESSEFRAAFAQRIPKHDGQTFTGFVEKASELEEVTADHVKRVQDSIVVRVKELSSHGVIGAQWAQLQLQFHDPAFAAQIEAASLASGLKPSPPPEPSDHDESVSG